MTTKNEIENIESAVESLLYHRDWGIKQILNYIFWKDYSNSLVSPDDKQEIFNLADMFEIKGGDEAYIENKGEEMIKLANKIRINIGLKPIKVTRGFIEVER